MFELKGKYNKATIFTDTTDQDTISQIITLLNQEFIKESTIRIMPDCHTGKGCVIGTTMKITDKVVPNLVGVDIGCGVKIINLGKIDIDYQALDAFVYENIPSGMNVNERVIQKYEELEDLRCYSNLKKINYLEKSLGTLGGGNHFLGATRF